MVDTRTEIIYYLDDVWIITEQIYKLYRLSITAFILSVLQDLHSWCHSTNDRSISFQARFLDSVAWTHLCTTEVHVRLLCHCGN